jgi:hypothetical protein
MYQKLWALDEELAKEGASRDDEKTKQKYYDKESKRGGGKGGSGSGRKAIQRTADSAQIASALGASSVKDNKYQAIDRPKSYIPDLQLSNKAKTNLKKSISIQKGVKYV